MKTPLHCCDEIQDTGRQRERQCFAACFAGSGFTCCSSRPQIIVGAPPRGAILTHWLEVFQRTAGAENEIAQFVGLYALHGLHGEGVAWLQEKTMGQVHWLRRFTCQPSPRFRMV
jgi:hypothetical protein